MDSHNDFICITCMNYTTVSKFIGCLYCWLVICMTTIIAKMSSGLPISYGSNLTTRLQRLAKIIVLAAMFAKYLRKVQLNYADA